MAVVRVGQALRQRKQGESRREVQSSCGKLVECQSAKHIREALEAPVVQEGVLETPKGRLLNATECRLLLSSFLNTKLYC